jgi:hypothetical protein
VQGGKVANHQDTHAYSVHPEKAGIERETLPLGLQAREAKAQEHGEGNNS